MREGKRGRERERERERGKEKSQNKRAKKKKTEMLFFPPFALVRTLSTAPVRADYEQRLPFAQLH